jgi:hypothetical protein
MKNLNIHPTVKNEIITRFGNNPLSELFIKTYEGVLNKGIENGKSVNESSEIAMKSLLELSKLLNNA